MLCFFLHRLVAVVKDKRKKKKRQTSVVQQQSTSQMHLTSLSAAKERKHGKRRQATCSKNKADENESAMQNRDDSSSKDSRGRGQLVRWRGRCVQPTDDVSSEDELTDQHVHKNKRSKLKRNDSGHKTFPTSSPSQAPRCTGLRGRVFSPGVKTC